METIILAFIPNWGKFAAAAAMCAALIASASYYYGKHEARQEVAVEAAKQTAIALKKGQRLMKGWFS